MALTRSACGFPLSLFMSHARHWLVGALCGACLWLSASPVWADVQPLVGGHVGVNLDAGNLHLGADLVVPVAHVSPQVQLSVWPSFAHVFIHDTRDVNLLGVDFPFELRLADASVTPYFAPGLALSMQYGVQLKVNLLGGCFFDLGSRVRLFTELAIRLVNGTYVDLLGGILFAL